jgi:hypothetical protein
MKTLKTLAFSVLVTMLSASSAFAQSTSGEVLGTQSSAQRGTYILWILLAAAAVGLFLFFFAKKRSLSQRLLGLNYNHVEFNKIGPIRNLEMLRRTDPMLFAKMDRLLFTPYLDSNRKHLGSTELMKFSIGGSDKLKAVVSKILDHLDQKVADMALDAACAFLNNTRSSLGRWLCKAKLILTALNSLTEVAPESQMVFFSLIQSQVSNFDSLSERSAIKSTKENGMKMANKPSISESAPK